MSDSNNADNKASLVPANSENSTLIVEDNHKEQPQSKNSNNASTQMQLIGLAKQFVIDGALIPESKQATLEERSIKREKIAYLRKQQNLEMIIQKAVQYCSDNEVADRADKDWFNNFISLAEDVSNKTMQDLWAKILAGEISSPGSFSLKSLKAFKDLSIHDAKLLAKACAVAVKDKAQKNLRIISGAYQTPGLFNFFSKDREIKVNLNNFGLSYAELLNLADNKLIFIQETETTPISSGSELSFIYNGINLTLKANKNNSLISFYKFTPIGAELGQLIGDKPDSKYISHLKNDIGSIFAISS